MIARITPKKCRKDDEGGYHTASTGHRGLFFSAHLRREGTARQPLSHLWSLRGLLRRACLYLGVCLWVHMHSF